MSLLEVSDLNISSLKPESDLFSGKFKVILGNGTTSKARNLEKSQFQKMTTKKKSAGTVSFSGGICSSWLICQIQSGNTEAVCSCQRGQQCGGGVGGKKHKKAGVRKGGFVLITGEKQGLQWWRFSSLRHRFVSNGLFTYQITVRSIATGTERAK